MQEKFSESSKHNILVSYPNEIITISIIVTLVITMYIIVSTLYNTTVGQTFVKTTLALGLMYAMLFFILRLYLIDDTSRSITVATILTISRGFLAVISTSLFLTSLGIYDIRIIRWLIGTVFAISVSFDLIDGWIARNKSEVTELGSRMDIETDALSTLLGSIIVVMSGLVSPFFLLVGLARYIYVIYFFVLYGDTEPSDSGNYQWLNQLLSFSVFASVSLCILPILEPNITSKLLSVVGIIFVSNFLRSLWVSRSN